VGLQVLFQYQDSSSADEQDLLWGEAHSCQYKGHSMRKGSSQVDFAIEVNNAAVTASFSSELFDVATIQRMLHTYMHLLQQLVQTPDTEAKSAEVLLIQDRQQLLGWGAGQQQFYHLLAPLVHESFAAAAAAAPDSCCLVFEGSSLSYKTVQHRAVGLAQQLQAAGVGPGVAVGVLLERSLELPIAVLAVFMAGGCYVPLDPSYPEQRLQGYLEDASAAFLLTRGSFEDLASKMTKDMGTKVHYSRFAVAHNLCDDLRATCTCDKT
jgi:non-ribosomal peptide synthetase component F